MTKHEAKALEDIRNEARAQVLLAMNNYIWVNEAFDEDDLYDWFTYGIPDSADEDDIAEMARDSELWEDAVTAFARLIQGYDT